MTKITPAQLCDCIEILNLQKLAYESEAKIYNDWSLPALTQTLDSLQQEFQTSLLLKAVANKEIVGSVRAKMIDTVCHIGRLIVHPDYQRQGIGSQLLTAIEQAYNHAAAYELFTGSKSEANIRLYRNHNYQISHTKDLSENVSLIYLVKHS